MNTLIGSRFYTALEASQETGLPLERVKTLFAEIVAEGKEPVAYYQGPSEAMLSGHTLLRRLAHLPEPPTYRPTTRGRRR